MIKYIIILMNMLPLLVVRMFFDGDITVKMSAPSQVKLGERFTVSITINKGSIAGVGHLKLVLPDGFGTATVVETKGSEFKYLPQDNVVKFTWIALPADQEFTVSYQVIVNSDAPKGNVTLGGKFSYVLNNEKKTFIVPDVSIIIGEYVEFTQENSPDDIIRLKDAKMNIEKGDVYFNKPKKSGFNYYTSALPFYLQAYTSNSNNPLLNYKIGVCYLNSESKENALPYLEKAYELQSDVADSIQPYLNQAKMAAHTTATPATTQPDTTATTTSEIVKTSATVRASRIIVGSPESGMEFTVEININKDGMKGFARIQEILPAGLTARSLSNKGGTFSFIDQKVKIIWDNLPADEDVQISYRVSVADNLSGNLAISGSFSYVENDDPKKIDIVPTTISVKEKTVLAATNTAAESNNTTDKTAVPKNQTVGSTIPEPENKIAYKVQICALSKIQRGTTYFEKKFTIINKVNMEFHEGWKKYIVGKYNQYKDARDYRELVRSKGIENPFVAAYNSGKRITVQEALMISNQQWLR